jgi:hypothetical protein
MSYLVLAFVLAGMIALLFGWRIRALSRLDDLGKRNILLAPISLAQRQEFSRPSCANS